MDEAMIFEDRVQAGQQLAQMLKSYAGRKDLVVLGIPRGGVPVAFEVAKVLQAPLDIFFSRKLGVPGQEELAFGAITSGGARVVDQDLVEELRISEEEIEQITEGVKHELERREKLYRGGRAPLRVEGKIVILIDDGIATGASMRVAIKALRQMKPSRLIVAVPVAPASTCHKMKAEVDELVCVSTPEFFYAIGQFYQDFSQVTDEEVIDLLHQSAKSVASTHGSSALKREAKDRSVA